MVCVAWARGRFMRVLVSKPKQDNEPWVGLVCFYVGSTAGMLDKWSQKRGDQANLGYGVSDGVKAQSCPLCLPFLSEHQANQATEQL